MSTEVSPTSTRTVCASAANPERSPALLEVRDLRVHDGATHRTIVDGVGFSVNAGETVALVGESGSGKSMTAKAAMGLLPAGVVATGSVSFQGREILGLGERALRDLRGVGISMLLQDPFTMLNPMTTAGLHISESLTSANVRGTRDRKDLRSEVARRLDEVGIGDPAVANRFPFELSGGMRQRVALAAATAQDPQLLIADEPTTALDATTQREVLRLLRSMQRARQMGLLLITHNLGVAFAMADRVLVMYGGRVLEAASVDALQRGVSHPYSYGLLRAIPSAERRQRTLIGIEGSVPRADHVRDRCAFAARCKWAAERCTAARPQLRLVGSEQSSACVRYEELSKILIAEPQDVGIDDEEAATRTPAAEPFPLLQVERLTKTYGSPRQARRKNREPALGGVTFALETGQSIGIVGESGSGKTTLARCLLGLETPTTGTIKLSDFDISSYHRLSAKARKTVRAQIQCVFQDPYSSLNPSHTIGFALGEAIRHRSNSAGEDKAPADAEISDLLSAVGLPDHYKDRRPVSLSGGERQRVAIARALAMHPKILVCDEPVAALDVSVQALVLEVLRSVQASGVSLVFITHDLSVVRQMTDSLVVLHRGVIVESGATESVLQNPNAAYTRDLLAAVPSGASDWLGTQLGQEPSRR